MRNLLHSYAIHQIKLKLESIDLVKLNMYNLTGKRGLYGLFPTKFNHRGMNIRDNPKVK